MFREIKKKVIVSATTWQNMCRLGMGITELLTIRDNNSITIQRFCDNQYIAKQSSEDASQYPKNKIQRPRAEITYFFTAHLKKILIIVNILPYQ